MLSLEQILNFNIYCMHGVGEIESTSTKSNMFAVLCILSCINGVFNIMSEVVGLLTIDNSSDIKDSLNIELKNLDNVKMGLGEFVRALFSSITDVIEYMRVLSVMEILSSILVLVSIYLMWNLKKIGLSIYIISQLILVFAPVVIIGFNFFVGLSMIFNLFLSILFIILYTVSIKRIRIN